jgi:hypothetical protein
MKEKNESRWLRMAWLLRTLDMFLQTSSGLRLVSRTSATMTSVSMFLFTSGFPFIPTRQCSLLWLSQCPVLPVLIIRWSWLVFTQIISSTRLYPQSSKLQETHDTRINWNRHSHVPWFYRQQGRIINHEQNIINPVIINICPKIHLPFTSKLHSTSSNPKKN